MLASVARRVSTISHHSHLLANNQWEPKESHLLSAKHHERRRQRGSRALLSPAASRASFNTTLTPDRPAEGFGGAPGGNPQCEDDRRDDERQFVRKMASHCVDPDRSVPRTRRLAIGRGKQLPQFG